MERATLLPTIRAVSGSPDVSVTLPEDHALPEHVGMVQEQPARGFPSPHCVTFPLGLLAGFWLSPSALAGGMGPALRRDLNGLPERVRDQGDWLEGRWAQLKNSELLRGFKDTPMQMSLRTPTWPLG